MLPLQNGLKVDVVPLRSRGHHRLTVLNFFSDSNRRLGAFMKYLSHSPSWLSDELYTPSLLGTIHLA